MKSDRDNAASLAVMAVIAWALWVTLIGGPADKDYQQASFVCVTVTLFYFAYEVVKFVVRDAVPWWMRQTTLRRLVRLVLVLPLIRVAALVRHACARIYARPARAAAAFRERLNRVDLPG